MSTDLIVLCQSVIYNVVTRQKINWLARSFLQLVVTVHCAYRNVTSDVNRRVVRQLDLRWSVEFKVTLGTGCLGAICPWAGKNSAPTGSICAKFWIHSEFGGNFTKNSSAVREDLHTWKSLVFIMECSL